MNSSNQYALKAAPFTVTLSQNRVVITALHIGDGFLLVASASRFVYKVDLVTESVEVLAQVKDVWSLTCRDSNIIFGSLDGEIHVLDILDNGTVVSGSRDGTIRLWTLESG